MDDRELSRKAFVNRMENIHALLTHKPDTPRAPLSMEGADLRVTMLKDHDLALRERFSAAQTELLSARLQNEQLTREAIELRLEIARPTETVKRSDYLAGKLVEKVSEVERLTKERDEARRLFERATLGYAHSDEIESLGAELQRLRDALARVRSVFAGDKSHPRMIAFIDSALSGSPEPAPTRNSVALASFVDYCKSHPFERFWQALRNWSKWNFILAAYSRNGSTLDTFDIEGLDGCAAPTEKGKERT